MLQQLLETDVWGAQRVGLFEADVRRGGGTRLGGSDRRIGDGFERFCGCRVNVTGCLDLVIVSHCRQESPRRANASYDCKNQTNGYLPRGHFNLRCDKTSLSKPYVSRVLGTREDCNEA